jgi:hypothetical protein
MYQLKVLFRHLISILGAQSLGFPIVPCVEMCLSVWRMRDICLILSGSRSFCNYNRDRKLLLPHTND